MQCKTFKNKMNCTNGKCETINYIREYNNTNCDCVDRCTSQCNSMDIDFDPAPITSPIDNEPFNSPSPESINLSSHYSSSNAASAPPQL